MGTSIILFTYFSAITKYVPINIFELLSSSTSTFSYSEEWIHRNAMLEHSVNVFLNFVEFARWFSKIFFNNLHLYQLCIFDYIPTDSTVITHFNFVILVCVM